MLRKYPFTKKSPMFLISTVLFFVISVMISFVGSLQLGPVNLAVINTALNRGYKPALLMGLGGSLPELFYSAAAFWLADLLLDFPQVMKTVYMIIAPVFVLIGFYLVYTPTRIKEDKTVSGKSAWPLLGGFVLGSLNPMLLPFWVIVIGYLNEWGINANQHLYTQLSFILGTASGAMMLQYSLATLIIRQKEKFKEKFIRYANPVTGIAFILIGIIQFLRVTVF
jgi:threonine/homoserine/homoserine lactone efflux protein